MRVVRAEVAHARVRSIDAAEARALPGVVDVLTAADVVGLPSIPLRLDLAVNLDAY
jgi:xanthine dehydrogenase molybdopterin-binding subunit B